MARIPPVIPSEAISWVRVALERHCARFKTRVTNMKCTLAHSLTAFDVYMQWYIVFDDMRLILGLRQAYLYGYAISKGCNCFLWTTYFRKFIEDGGEDPEHLELKEKEHALMDFGRAVARNHGKTPQALFDHLSKFHNPRRMVDIVSFAGQMVAACVFCNAMEVELDDYLKGYVTEKDPS